MLPDLFIYFACSKIYSWMLVVSSLARSQPPAQFSCLAAGSFKGGISGPIKHHPCALQPPGAEDAEAQVPYLCLGEVRI